MNSKRKCFQKIPEHSSVEVMNKTAKTDIKLHFINFYLYFIYFQLYNYRTFLLKINNNTPEKYQLNQKNVLI